MSNRQHSRLNKFEKRRKTTKLITYLLIAAGVLVVVLIGVFVFSDSDAEKQREQASDAPKLEQKKSKPATATEGDQISRKKEDKQDKENADDQDKAQKDKDDEKDKDALKTKRVEPSDDNVAEAFTANWKPIGTSQSGPHTTNYDEGSQDRKEMEAAIKEATGLGDMTTWWLERGGEQQVVATVSNKADESEVYRVQLKWVDAKGWKPAKVELLKENDQKYRFR